MNIQVILSFTIAIFLSGCVLINPSIMSQENKRVIYQSIQNEIEEYKIQADIFYKTGYYADAVKAYEMINFYEDREVIPLKRINSVRLKAISNANFHYKQAQKYLKDNKKRALIELNKMMRNNPEHKEGQILFETIKQDIEIQAILKIRQETLQKALTEDRENIETLKKISVAMNSLSEYDESNSLVLDAKNIMKQKRTILLNEAIMLYNQGHFEFSEKKFQQIHSIYSNDPICKKYLTRISSKKAFKINLAKAKDALKTEDYLLVIAFCEKAMQYEANNAEALNLINKAKEEYKKQIPKIIDDGKMFYNKQDFKSAKEIFESVLRWDAKNNIALAYIKKINQQIKTIESLR